MDLSKRIKRHITAVPHEFRAICHPGFEATSLAEFKALGLDFPVQMSFGAIDFSARIEDAWKILAFSRTVIRLVMRIANFNAENFARLEKKAAEIPWELYFPRSETVPAIRVSSRKSRLYHTDAVAERLAPIVAESLEKNGISSASPTGEPQTLFVHFENDRCILSADLAGEPLYKRGFDRHVEEAPLRDTLAAAILFEAGLPTAKFLCDPMSGSGTFSSEAALLAAGAAPFKTRRFACEDAPAFRPAAWRFLTTHAHGIPTDPALSISASDLSTSAFSTIEYNLMKSGATPFLKSLSVGSLSVRRQDFFALPKAAPGTLLVLNPPYGKRIRTNVPLLFREIGQKIRKDFAYSRIAIMAPSDEAVRALDLRQARTIRTLHGGIEVNILFRDGKASH